MWTYYVRTYAQGANLTLISSIIHLSAYECVCVCVCVPASKAAACIAAELAAAWCTGDS